MTRSRLSENKFYIKAKEKAAGIVGDKDRMGELVSASKEKLQGINFEDSKISRMAVNLRIIIRMIRAYANGSYRELPWKSLIALVAGVVYFLMPLDLMPDFIPFTGFLDDFTVIMLLSGAFQRDIEAFLLWEGGIE
jgi:uncharacterized membrane protein YkvA (DUF1232 family)